MDHVTEDRLEAVFQILDEQHRISKERPHAAKQIQKDMELSARLRELIDQLSPDGQRSLRVSDK